MVNRFMKMLNLTIKQETASQNHNEILITPIRIPTLRKANISNCRCKKIIMYNWQMNQLIQRLWKTM